MQRVSKILEVDTEETAMEREHGGGGDGRCEGRQLRWKGYAMKEGALIPN